MKILNYFNKMFSYLKNKNSKGYYILVNFIFIRIYELIWVYIINFKGYLLYKEWNKNLLQRKPFYKIPQEINSTKFKDFHIIYYHKLMKN